MIYRFPPSIVRFTKSSSERSIMKKKELYVIMSLPEGWVVDHSKCGCNGLCYCCKYYNTDTVIATCRNQFEIATNDELVCRFRENVLNVNDQMLLGILLRSRKLID